MSKQETIKYLTELLGVIQMAYYKKGLFAPVVGDEHSGVCGGLWVHEGSDPDAASISIDLYNFGGDGQPVCDGLKPCTIAYGDGSMDVGHLFCMCYDPDSATPLAFLFSYDGYGDRGDIEVEPESIPAYVLENIVRWIEGQFPNNENK